MKLMREIVNYFQINFIEDVHISQVVDHCNKLFMNYSGLVDYAVSRYYFFQKKTRKIRPSQHNTHKNQCKVVMTAFFVLLRNHSLSKKTPTT